MTKHIFLNTNYKKRRIARYTEKQPCHKEREREREIREGGKNGGKRESGRE